MQGLRLVRGTLTAAAVHPYMLPMVVKVRAAASSTAAHQIQPQSTEEEEDDAWGGPGVDRFPGQKRSVAMHVAYAGTHFRGLQLSRDFPAENTVEGLLERALLQAGLIAPSNYGDLFKIKWTRSSRTDKGVHSLATVIGVRVVFEGADDLFERDPEGLELAARINQQLPGTVRVLSVQRVNKKFNARRFCKDRSYEYLLPAYILDLKCDQSESDREKLKVFREALALYVGKHPFHNFTVRRKQYLETPATRAAAAQAAAEQASHDGEQAALQQAHSQTPPTEKRRKKRDDDEAVVDDDGGDVSDAVASETEDDPQAAAAAGEQTGNGSETGQKRWTQLCSWKDEISADDRVGVRHYRVINEFTADDPQPLVPGGVPCLRLRVTGGSFMLNQIRHMIGGAVAVTCGHMSMDLLRVSLSAPSRVSVPKAPPHTLCLSGVTFPPFRLCGGVAKVAKYSGDALELRAGGQAAQQAFQQSVLALELDRLSQHQDWDRFKTSLDWFYWDPEAVEQVLTSHQAWVDARQKSKTAAVTPAEHSDSHKRH